jgi:hypothetical protein
MLRRLIFLCTALLAACSKGDEKPAMDSTAAAPPAATMTPPPPPPITLADVAGKWTIATMAADKDTTLVTWEMVATASDSGWQLIGPKRKPVPIRVVSFAGDSVITESGPYESMLRKGQKVSTHSVMHLKDGKLTGNTTAHYVTAKADSVLQLRTVGTRMP